MRDLFKIGAETEVNLQKARNELAVAERLYKKALDEKNKPTQNLNIDIKSAELDIKLQKSRIDEIKDELETANNIAAPDDGVITALNCQKGSTLDPSVPLYTMSLPAGGFRLKVAVDSTKANYLVTGDEVEISINSLNEEKVKGKIIAITTPAVDKPGENNNLQKVIVIDLELKTLVGGEHADIYLKKETKNYEMLIPNEAVREERNDYYVFVIKESEGPLGKEYYIQKIKVFCEASDDSYTAVSGGLLFSDRVVFSSDKPLSEGDRVRITKGNKGSGV
ncbi:membrane-fusion protein [Ruminiclostridium cellobioparum subsp. termitidis CT1112]|uniref:Membrane-fusion protein n=1 Tax=Ruminiclostridium cellobioparum subsp. termitidis CT1112 TaxID=1195236 RepID=S0FKG4_RUMCE|nr:membrane-fusion protein [Ruminiclostridium cellobioparum subsp. termitidis CT1112]